MCILGRNGVGKTTTMRTIMGILKPRSGVVRFEGANVGGMPPYKMSRLGVAYVPQGRHIFPNLTTKENLSDRGPQEAQDRARNGIFKESTTFFPFSETARISKAAG